MKYTLMILFAFFSTAVFSQDRQSTELFKKFMTACNVYKQLPLQLGIEYKKQTNIPLYEDDNTDMQGIFYLQKDAVYIRFGNAEQIITDSLALMIMGNINQMVLSENSMDISSQVDHMIYSPLKDSTITEFEKKYSIRQTYSGKDNATLEITNRQNLYSTELPFETITLTYKLSNNYPEKISTLKRSLIKKPEQADLQIKAAVVSIPQKGDYLIKEDRVEYLYTTITHDPNKLMPVSMADRIQKDVSGTFVPVKAYQHYKLILN